MVGAAGTAPLLGSPAITTPTRVKNLIFMVSDGMCGGTLAAANHHHNITRGMDCEWLRLYREVNAHRGLMETSSASSIVTDSAAAGSAWGCGQRIPNRQINVNADGQALTPLYVDAKRQGRRLGLVTTTRLTHATPASFVANQLERNDEDEIAPQFLEREVDILLGGGHRFFAPDQREDGADLYEQFRLAGYAMTRDKRSLMANRDARQILGVYAQSHMPYALDRANDPDLATVPGLMEMTAAALRSIGGARDGFILQIEAGRVDHAGHANDPSAILQDQLEFDRCISLVRDFASHSPETLVIVTTDHGTGGFMLNGEGPSYNETTERFQRITSAKASFEAIGESVEAGEMDADGLGAALGLEMTGELREQLAAVLSNWDADDWNYLGHALRPILAPWNATSWTTHNHTGEMAEFAAFGPGANAFGAYFENWEVHHRIRDLMGI